MRQFQKLSFALPKRVSRVYEDGAGNVDSVTAVRCSRSSDRAVPTASAVFSLSRKTLTTDLLARFQPAAAFGEPEFGSDGRINESLEHFRDRFANQHCDFCKRRLFNFHSCLYFIAWRCLVFRLHERGGDKSGAPPRTGRRHDPALAASASRARRRPTAEADQST